jgi:hypothetical protein
MPELPEMEQEVVSADESEEEVEAPDAEYLVPGNYSVGTAHDALD